MIVYVDMDDVLTNYTPTHARLKTENPHIPFPQGIVGFFADLPPIDGAVSAVNHLRQQYNVFILTAPSVRNPHCYSEKRIWIEEHFDYEFTKKLIISPDKGLLKGDYLIDDHVVGKGQERFEGELIHFGSMDFPDWEAVLRYLIA